MNSNGVACQELGHLKHYLLRPAGHLQSGRLSDTLGHNRGCLERSRVSPKSGQELKPFRFESKTGSSSSFLLHSHTWKLNHKGYPGPHQQSSPHRHLQSLMPIQANLSVEPDHAFSSNVLLGSNSCKPFLLRKSRKSKQCKMCSSLLQQLAITLPRLSFHGIAEITEQTPTQKDTSRARALKNKSKQEC